jgi:ribosome biogenesis GTPase / thiamine phosphate phosphatase
MISQKISIQTENQVPNSHLYHLGWSSFFQEQLEGKDVTSSPARVVGVRKNCFLVSKGNGELLVTMAGSLINDPAVSYPAVGDWVLLRGSVIISIFSRQNALTRKASGGKNRKNGEVSVQDQIIAANLDKTFIVCGLDRDFNLRRIERYLTMVYNCGITPEIILTKADLHQSPDLCVDEVESVAFGVPIYLVSAKDEDVITQLKFNLPRGITAALIGSSGAGKSTLINRLYGEEIQATGSVSESLGKGKHTTTNRDLIILASGGMLIDNPGIREIGLGVGCSKTESAFPEIDKLSRLCKFQDCSHTHEPGCQVLKAVSTGQLTRARLNSYQKILSELAYLSNREIKGAARVEKEQWKGVSQKIKNMKKMRKQ